MGQDYKARSHTGGNAWHQGKKSESKRSAFLYLRGFICRSEGGQRSVNIASVNKLPKNPSEQVCVFVLKC